MMTLMTDEVRGNGVKSDAMEKCEKLIVRSNWKGYLEEFKSAVGVWGETGGSFEEFQMMMGDGEPRDEWVPTTSPPRWETAGPRLLDVDVGGTALTNFEAKYIECGEPIYELSVLSLPSVEE